MSNGDGEHSPISGPQGLDPSLDRVAVFDERSRSYGIAALIETPPEREQRVWTPRDQPLDQGQEGACVGFGLSAELAATPVEYQVDNAYAFDLYHAAQAQDRAMGNYFPSGASLLAGVRACAEQRLINEYRWAFGIEQVIDAILDKGPVVLGIPWYVSMYRTDEQHMVHVAGELAGGHCILAHGYIPDHPVGENGIPTEVIVLTNSWGSVWGDNGTGYITKTDLDRLLQDNGDACIPTDTSHQEPGPPGYQER